MTQSAPSRPLRNAAPTTFLSRNARGVTKMAVDARPNDEKGQGAASFTDATCVMRACLLDKTGSAFMNG